MYKEALQFLRSARAGTLAMVQGLSQEQMDFRPRPGKWSIGEILDHLVLSEKVYRQQIEGLIERAKAGQRTVVSVRARDVNFSPVFLPKSFLPFMEVPLTMMTMFIPSAVRELMIRYDVVPGQNPDVAVPKQGRSADELRRELAAALEQTASLLDANSGLNYQKMVAQHPLMGNNNVMQLLRVVALHELRHQDQIRNILESPKFARLGQAAAKSA